MAGIVGKLARTGAGRWLWRRLQTPRGRAVSGVLSGAVEMIETLLSRHRPAHRRHDRAQRATLADFEAETARRSRE